MTSGSLILRGVERETARGRELFGVLETVYESEPTHPCRQ